MTKFPMVCAAALTLGLVACDDSGNHHTMRRDPSRPGGGASEETISVTFENATDRAFYGLYLVPTDGIHWGPNQLDEDLEPNDILTLDGVPCDDYYDFKAVGEGNVVIELLDSYFECGAEPLVTLEGP